MTKLEVFFDYSCPFCRRGYNSFIELLPEYPEMTVVWCPCEAHPRPEKAGRHSDLCIRGMFFAAENGVDLSKYHQRMFALYHDDKIDVEDIDILAEALKDLLDAHNFCQAINNGKYVKELQDANDYAYEQSGVWVLPAFRMDGRKLDAMAGAGVTKEQLKDFLDQV